MAIGGSIVVIEGTKVAIEAIKAFADYSIAYEKEITERERIRATLEVCLKELEAKSAIVQQALVQHHEERMKLYGLFQVGLEKSIERGDHAMYEKVSQTLLLIYEKAPKLSEVSAALPSKSKKELSLDE